MDHEEQARRASSFGSQAAAYAQYRPDYPADLLSWALAPLRGTGRLRVVDIGAGTGKLTGGLLGQDVDVVAVEPDPAMLAELTSRFPDVAAMSGTAEEIPLPDSSVHAAFAGQALHWFDLDRALPEIGRVLRPGGFLVAMWNSYDDASRGWPSSARSPVRWPAPARTSRATSSTRSARPRWSSSRIAPGAPWTAW